MFELVEIQHHVALSTQVPLKSIQCDPDNVPMMNPVTSGYLADFQPNLVNQLDIFIRKAWRVRAEIEGLLDAVRTQNPETDAHQGRICGRLCYKGQAGRGS